MPGCPRAAWPAPTGTPPKNHVFQDVAAFIPSFARFVHGLSTAYERLIHSPGMAARAKKSVCLCALPVFQAMSARPCLTGHCVAHTDPSTLFPQACAPRMCINAALHSLLSLLFQEQIKGPENAPIARFDGLGCYQIHSEIDGGFRSGGQAPGRKKRAARATPESALAAWLQRLKRSQCPRRMFWRALACRHPSKTMAKNGMKGWRF